MRFTLSPMRYTSGETAIHLILTGPNSTSISAFPKSIIIEDGSRSITLTWEDLEALLKEKSNAKS